MMLIRNRKLKKLNSFGIAVEAASYFSLTTVRQLQRAIRQEGLGALPWLVLGGGSNVLFTRNFPGTLLHNNILGKEVRILNDHEVLVEAGSGEEWHELAMWCVRQGFGGIENLSLIPGRVGAAPIQNIGAYGCELANVFEWLEAVEIATGQVHRFYREECSFGYRNSIFKGAQKGRFCITKVALRLTSRNHHINTAYGAIQSRLDEWGIREPGIEEMSKVVIDIRRSKLPDPEVLGNAGSFFKNPIIPLDQYQALLRSYPDLPSYPGKDGARKVPAGWLIETCGWKGHRAGRVGVYDHQALVLVNYGEGTGKEILDLATKIQSSVFERFGIELQPEVNIL